MIQSFIDALNAFKCCTAEPSGVVEQDNNPKRMQCGPIHRRVFMRPLIYQSLFIKFRPTPILEEGPGTPPGASDSGF